MSHHPTSENSDAGLFPFLAVLLCTMGALLVVLVVMAQRVGKRVVQELHAATTTTTQELAHSTEHEEAAIALASQLAAARAHGLRLNELQEQTEQQLQREQQRLSHLEEHTRRLEHELAHLGIVAQQLEATENNQVVDHEQADGELVRLQQLVKELQARLDRMRSQAVDKQSYAILPYQGPHGTYRKPIYIECSREGIVLHPEGVRLSESDFRAPDWPGNPLAAALRASRHYLNSQAVRRGKPEPPDPYPLILVRPDGLRQYAQARAAIQSWDADFGYEFIDSDWQLEFPELPDPQLAHAQEHALITARQRLERLAQSAPRRFLEMTTGGPASGRSGQSGGRGWGEDGSANGANRGAALSQTGGGASTEGNQRVPGSDSLAGSEASATGDELQPGAMRGESAGDAGATFTDSSGGSGASEESSYQLNSSHQGIAMSEAGGSDDRYAHRGGAAATDAAAGASGSHRPATGAGGQAGAGGPSAAGSSPSGGASAASGQMASSVGDQGGNRLSRQAALGSVPIRRTIHVVVRRDHLALLPGRHETLGAAAAAIEISLDQSEQQVSEALVTALRDRMNGWGLAGSGLYWRPVLEVNVGPDVGHSAVKIMRLLRGSGIEIKLPETARMETRHESL